MARPRKPQVNSAGERELDKVAKQFDAFDNEVKEATQARFNEAPKEEVEPQTKMSQKQVAKGEIWLKPKTTLFAVDPKTGKANQFNEKFRKDYEFKKEYVKFIAENRELQGQHIELWTLPFGGMPAEEWIVPTNVVVWGPRYLAERLKGCYYHRLVMQEQAQMSSDGVGTYHGKIVADSTVQRLDAVPVGERRSVFMGASSF